MPRFGGEMKVVVLVKPLGSRKPGRYGLCEAHAEATARAFELVESVGRHPSKQVGA